MLRIMDMILVNCKEKPEPALSPFSEKKLIIVNMDTWEFTLNQIL